MRKPRLRRSFALPAPALPRLPSRRRAPIESRPAVLARLQQADLRGSQGPIMGGRYREARQCGSPGSGGASPYLPRRSRVFLPGGVLPSNLGRLFWRACSRPTLAVRKAQSWGRYREARQPGSPGSGGASPYLRRGDTPLKIAEQARHPETY